ncbi:STAS domain-containing protein [Streptomyces sp. NBC_01615]|uniref:STAS domain-containing protein n=1 Tax=Streptomyces sp. NBC_01615 TaxID=2975898 RepID=UPI0038643501
MVAVLALGVLQGLLVAVILALLQLLRRVAWPHDAVLTVADDGTPREAAPDESADTGVLVYRLDAPLFFANANRVQYRILTLAAAWSPYPRYVVLDTEAVFHVDATGAQVLARLTADLREHHCELVLARRFAYCAYEANAPGVSALVEQWTLAPLTDTATTVTWTLAIDSNPLVHQLLRVGRRHIDKLFREGTQRLEVLCLGR